MDWRLRIVTPEEEYSAYYFLVSDGAENSVLKRAILETKEGYYDWTPVPWKEPK